MKAAVGILDARRARVLRHQRQSSTGQLANAQSHMISTQNGVRYEPPRAEGGARVPQSPMALSRDLLTTLTIVNTKDSLFEISENFRSIVEFPGQGLG